VTVAAAVLDLPALTRELVDGSEVPVDEVHRTTARLLGMTVANRRALPYMHPGRADVIGAGALVLDRVLARTSVASLRVSVRDILDGIAWSVV
jgi:exopolyphosphatase/guanosine-5'-triphosphate,3'-diphosphate pyrophosphatase